MDRLIWADSGDVDAFLEAVNDLIGAVQEVDAAGTNRALLDRVDVLLNLYMARLEDEFQAAGSGPTAATMRTTSAPGTTTATSSSQSPWSLPPSSFLLPMAEPRAVGGWGWHARARAPRHIGVAVAPDELWMWHSCA
jgi:hypothetical protein